MSAIGVGKELKLPTAGRALEVMLDNVGRPLVFEEILKCASAFQQFQPSRFDHPHHPQRKLKILAWLLKAQPV